jgi:ribosomal protein S18 acetylase RimI-like enzyme
MSNFLIEYSDCVMPGLQETAQQWMVDYESNYAVVCSYKEFSVVAKDKDKQIIAILLGYTEFDEIHIEDICVKLGYRNKGLGSMLLREIEDRFTNKGYNNINLITNQFQAAEFYKKCGFEVEFIRENKENPKLTKTFFIKYLK